MISSASFDSVGTDEVVTAISKLSVVSTLATRPEWSAVSTVAAKAERKVCWFIVFALMCDINAMNKPRDCSIQ